jgi:homoserine acetyltransferase
MGAQQAYQWAVSYPDSVGRIVAWCGHAHTTPHTYVFLDGLSSVLTAASDWNGGDYKAPPVKGTSRSSARICRLGNIACLVSRCALESAWVRDARRIRSRILGKVLCWA